MIEKPNRKGHTKMNSDGGVEPEDKSNMVFSDIPWEDYMDRMKFSGKTSKGAKTITRSITFDCRELRLAEIILENDRRSFQTVSDVIRDAVKKGLAIDYEICVKQKGKIKRRGEALYRELDHIDEELLLIRDTEMVEERIGKILKESVKGILGKGKEWAEKEIENMIVALEGDYPNRGIREYFYDLLHKPRDVADFLSGHERKKKAKVFGD